MLNNVYMDLTELLRTRRTYRRFLQKEIPQRVIDEVLVSATYASSAANLQPLRYIVIKTPMLVKNVAESVRWAAYLPRELGTPAAEAYPALFVAVIQDMGISKKCDVDVGLAISNMTLTAWSYSVGSCIIGSFNRDVMEKLLQLPENQTIHTLIAFGYPLHKSLLIDADNGDIKYSLNDDGDFVVPKRKVEEITHYL